MKSKILLQAVAVTLLVVTISSVDAKPSRVPWWQIQVTRSQGPNACIVEEVPELNRKYYTECKYWPVRKVCGKETVIRYECCEGYKQMPGEEGCNGVKPLKNVLDTARELGATKFVRYLEDSGIAAELRQEGTYTLFAPIDAAFDSVSGAAIATQIESYLRLSENPVLRYHISNKKYPSRDFAANNEIESQYVGTMLRISKYSTGMETVNCVLISRKDQEASNGIVHMIDHPLDPTLFIARDVAQIVIHDGRFTKLANAIQRCGFLPRLREPGKSYTLLAPSDEAFLKIPPARLEKMLNDRESCTALLEHHVIPHVMCTPVITEQFRARTIGPKRVGFDCDEKGHTVGGTKVGEYIMGQNGVVYMLDDVLIPDRVRTVVELMESHNLRTFAELVRVAGLEQKFNAFGDYTLFVPSEEAFYALDPVILDEARQNPTLARQICLFHAVQGRLTENSIRNNQLVLTLDEENSVRLLVHRKGYGVEDAVFEKGLTNLEGFNGVIHVVNKVIFPTSQSAGDILRKSANYSIFLRTMETVLVNDPETLDLRKGAQSSHHYTFFVPTDDAIRAMGSQNLRKLQSDQSYMTKFVRNHVSSSMMAAESFRPSLTYELPTRQNAVGVKCDKNKRMKVNDARVLQKDIMNSNGIIHVIDKPLVPDS